MALRSDGPPAFWRSTAFWPAEQVVISYLALFSLIALLRLGPGLLALRLVAVSGTLAGLLVVVARRTGEGSILGLRHWYLFSLLPLIYGNVGLVNKAFPDHVYDTLVQGWEQALFGGQVSREWWQAHPSVGWSTLLHAAYLAFYPVILAPSVYFTARGAGGAARRATLWVIATFAVSYLLFLVFPVAGPYYRFPRPSGAFVENPMAGLVYATLRAESAYGAAFPSSHVAAAWVATAAAAAASRRLAVGLAAVSALLSVAVVYTQMHYLIDALAGIGLAVLLILAGWWWEGRAAAGRELEGGSREPTDGQPSNPASLLSLRDR